jgi:ferredoxin-NADP reductase
VTTQAGSNNEWFEAAVLDVTEESPFVKTLVLEAPHPVTHIAGQHYELRLTAENGYQAARLYSAATAGNGDGRVKLSIMNVSGGEVSPYLTNILTVGNKVEIRGPFGKFFVWTKEEKRPVLLIGGGSGIVPLHAIFTSHQSSGSKTKMKVLYSSHTYDDILFKDVFLTSPAVTLTLTKGVQKGWTGLTGRITQNMIEDILGDYDEKPLCFVCGMSLFVDAVTTALQKAGVPSTAIKTERFG